jgi:hypothetical protein
MSNDCTNLGRTDVAGGSLVFRLHSSIDGWGIWTEYGRKSPEIHRAFFAMKNFSQ